MPDPGGHPYTHTELELGAVFPRASQCPHHVFVICDVVRRLRVFMTYDGGVLELCLVRREGSSWPQRPPPQAYLGKRAEQLRAPLYCSPRAFGRWISRRTWRSPGKCREVESAATL
jgi:hypothetical protein